MPLVTFAYPEKTSIILKVEKIYERISKDIQVKAIDGKNIVSIDLGIISNLIAFEGYIPIAEYAIKKALKLAAKDWTGGGKTKRITITIPYEDNTYIGVFKSLTITYIEGEKQWKFTAEFAENIVETE